MEVRAKKVAATRKFVNDQPPAAVPAQSFTFPAPVRGWILNENLATAQPAGARILDNWLCTPTGVRVRGGSVKHATLTGPVTSIFAYNSTTSAFFATTADGIFNITTPADPDTPLTATVSGQTSGEYSTAQFGTAGGNFLYAVNGADDAQLYDGATWTAIDGVSTPAITGVTTADLSHVWSYANRLFFVEGGTLNAWYLQVDSIGGAATSFSLAGTFRLGGSLLFGATWSLDSGYGLDDTCVFVSTEGEVAVYRGTNPSSASDWALQGVYRMPKPLGKNAYTQAGGDLLIATEVGLIPITAAIQSDIAAIESKAVSFQIARYWQDQARSISMGWEIVKTPRRGVMFISQPDTSGVTKTCLAVNLLTGAWSRCTGWDTRCLGYYEGNGYFGSADSCVYIMDVSGSDAGETYTAVVLGQHDQMGAYGVQKTIRQMRAVFQAGSPIQPQLSALPNFREDVSAPPASVENYTTDAWDSGMWDVAVWDSNDIVSNEANWTAAGVTGSVLAPELQLTFGVTPSPSVELVAIDVQFHAGAMVA
jgi:hypothetical protein